MTRRAHNPKAEEAVIGSIIRSDAAYWAVSAAQIGPEHFSDPTHRVIFEAIQGICEAGQKLTTQLLMARLPVRLPNEVSPASQIAVLAKIAEDAGAVSDYFEDLVEAFRWRGLARIADMLSASASDKTIDDLLSEIDAGVRGLSAQAAQRYERTLGEAVKAAMERANTAHQSGTSPGIDTGLPSLDEITGPMMPGDLVVIGAAQGEAKTSLALQIALHAARRGPVAFFELEMTAEDLARRLLAGHSAVKVETIESGTFEFDEFERVDAAGRDLSGYPLIVIDRPRMRVGEIRSRALSIKHSRGLAAVAIDHLRLVQPDGKVRDQFDRTEQVTGSLKALAKELNVPVLLLSQRTRGSQDRESPEPRVTDHHGGGSIEQDSDIMIGLWRRDLWLQQRRPAEKDETKFAAWQSELNACSGFIEAVCLKRRRGAAMGKRRFRFNGAATRLEEV